MNDPYNPKPVLQAVRDELGQIKNNSLSKDYKIIVKELKDFLRPVPSDQLRFKPPLIPSIEKKYEDEGLFDPLHNYKIKPESIEIYDGMVELYFKDEDLLFDRASWSSCAYNTIVYAIAMHLRKKEPLSERLQDFLIKHMMGAPQPKNPKNAGGQRKSTKLIYKKQVAIIIAVNAGLNATRNDEVLEKISACDAVEQAAKELRDEVSGEEFKIGYSYKTLKSHWLKYK